MKRFARITVEEEIMFFIFRLLIHMVAILIISYLLPGVIRVEGCGQPWWLRFSWGSSMPFSDRS